LSSFNINRVVLVGRLTRDPELRSLSSGASVCSLRLACNSSRRDPDGAFSERPNYFDVSVYGGPAETVARYMRKGRRIALDGRLEWREWEAGDGQRRQAVDVVADTVQFLDAPDERSRASVVERWDAPDGASEGNAEDGATAEQELAGVGAEAGELSI
jgi:single-strand DNA-binding protein